MDHLPIQASAVPCERVFSSSAETDTKKRNRLSPTLMEALQVLKFSLKKNRLNFTQGWVTSQHLLVEDEHEEPQADALDVMRSIDDEEENVTFESVTLFP
ncbi:hypothetical protein BJV78DRAFT_1139009 [Lactifluus subvellereus]|nr:hypothetical protein BJV78DRAFT_1139009 [Lactifluus subvellereus]